MAVVLQLGCSPAAGIDPELELERMMQPPLVASLDGSTGAANAAEPPAPPRPDPVGPAAARDAGANTRDVAAAAVDAVAEAVRDAGAADLSPSALKCLPYVDVGPNCAPRPRPPGVRSGRSAGCGKPIPPSGKQTIEVCQGRVREFIIKLPPSYDPGSAYPVIFAFHHAYGHMDAPFGYGNMGKELGASAIIVSPQALAPAREPCFRTWSRNFKDDLSLFDALYEQITATTCVDLGRTYATGLSSGGYFSAALGCQRGDVLRAVAPVAGGLRDFNACVGAVGAMVVVQGKDENLRQAYIKQNGCTKDAATRAAPDPKNCLAYSGCKAGAPVIGCSYGHAWPGFATVGMWTFFQSLPPAPQ